MSKIDKPKKPNGVDSANSTHTPRLKANVAVEAIFGDSRGIPDEPALLVINEGNDALSNIGIFRDQPGQENTVEVSVVVGKPNSPEEPLFEVITPDIVPPIVELVVSAMPSSNNEYIVLLLVEEIEYKPEETDVVQIGEITIVCSNWVKSVLDNEGIDIERDFLKVVQALSVYREEEE